MVEAGAYEFADTAKFLSAGEMGSMFEQICEP